VHLLDEVRYSEMRQIAETWRKNVLRDYLLYCGK